MNRAFATFWALVLTALALLLPGSGALAQGISSGSRVVAVERWVEEWDPASQQWVRVADAPATLSHAGFDSAATAVTRQGNTTVTETIVEEPVRFIASRARYDLASAGLASFGPFRVLDGERAAIVGATDARSPADFAAMMAAYPGLQVIEFLEAPGTTHDIANLKVGRAIRAAGLATHIPAGGSARSGAVELFLAGTRRTVDPGALFAVHSWRDALGREPADFAPDAPENRLYLDYYAEMGMSPEQARAFYAMTNSVPHAGAKWMEGTEMAQWIAPDPRAPASRLLEEGIDPRLEQGLRAALAKSGDTLGGLLRSLRMPMPGLQAALAPAPRLAYAEPATGLLDSWSAFP